MPVTRRPHQQRLRTDLDRVIDAAASVFGTQGFHTATMADVAEHAGTSKPTLYAHFGSKDALLEATLNREADVCRRWLFSHYERAAHLPMVEELTSGVAALFDYVAEHPEGFRLLFGPDAGGSQVAQVRTALLSDITDQVALRLHANNSPGRGQPGRTERQLASTIVGVAFSGAEFAERTGTSLDKARTTTTDFVVGAIVTMSNTPRAGRQR